MNKAIDCCQQRVQKGVKEGNSPNHYAQQKQGFDRVQVLKMAVDKHSWVESVHQD